MTAPTISSRTASSSVVIPARWNGPRRYGNGGYSAGVFARDFGRSARVVLRRPVPLERPLRIIAEGDESRVFARRRLIAEVADWRDAPPILPPVRPSMDAAEDAAARHPWTGMRHALSDCAICSPNRRDGLGVVPGVLADAPEMLAAPFHTDFRIADPLAPAVVSPEFVWAALEARASRRPTWSPDGCGCSAPSRSTGCATCTSANRSSSSAGPSAPELAACAQRARCWGRMANSSRARTTSGSRRAGASKLWACAPRTRSSATRTSVHARSPGHPWAKGLHW